jgi:hypothetical protein
MMQNKQMLAVHCQASMLPALLQCYVRTTPKQAKPAHCVAHVPCFAVQQQATTAA